MRGRGGLFLIAAGRGVLVALGTMLIAAALPVEGHLNISLSMRWGLGAVAVVIGLTGSAGTFVVAWSEYLDAPPARVALALASSFFAFALGFFFFSFSSITRLDSSRLRVRTSFLQWLWGR